MGRHQHEGLAGLGVLTSGELTSCPMPVSPALRKLKQADHEFEVACVTYQDPVKTQSEQTNSSNKK